jgi:quinol monooxygenase YgiN
MLQDLSSDKATGGRGREKRGTGTEESMVVEIIRYNIAAGQEAAFLEAYGQAQAHLAASPHCLAYRLSRCLKHRDRFILTIHWDSAEGHMGGFRKSGHFPPFYALVAPFFGQIEEMEHYGPTGIEWSRGV